MNCASVRDLLPEHALGIVNGEAHAIDRHLAGCAACRKEARDLQGAAATLAFALAPASPRSGLADDVSGAVKAAAGSPRRARSARRATTVLLAATVAMAGVLGGAAIARREPSEVVVAEARADAERDAIADFVSQALDDEGTVASLGVLRGVEQGVGGGTAVSVVAPDALDQVLVVANGLEGGTRYTVELVDGDGRFAQVGVPSQTDGGGGFTVGMVTARDLTHFVNVLVRDASGEVVMRGTLREELPPPTPAPAGA